MALASENLMWSDEVIMWSLGSQKTVHAVWILPHPFKSLIRLVPSIGVIVAGYGSMWWGRGFMEDVEIEY